MSGIEAGSKANPKLQQMISELQAAGLSNSEVGRRARVSPGAMSHYVTGRSPGNAKVVKAIKAVHRKVVVNAKKTTTTTSGAVGKESGVQVRAPNSRKKKRRRKTGKNKKSTTTTTTQTGATIGSVAVQFTTGQSVYFQENGKAQSGTVLGVAVNQNGSGKLTTTGYIIQSGETTVTKQATEVFTEVTDLVEDFCSQVTQSS